MTRVLELMTNLAKVQQAVFLRGCVRHNGSYVLSVLMLTDAPLADIRTYLEDRRFSGNERMPGIIENNILILISSGKIAYAKAALDHYGPEAFAKTRFSMLQAAANGPGGDAFLRWLEARVGLPEDRDELERLVRSCALGGNFRFLRRLLEKADPVLTENEARHVFHLPLISGNCHSLKCLTLLLPLARATPTAFGYAMFLALWRKDTPYRIRNFFREHVIAEDYDQVLAELGEVRHNCARVKQVLDTLLAWGADPAKVAAARADLVQAKAA